MNNHHVSRCYHEISFVGIFRENGSFVVHEGGYVARYWYYGSLYSDDPSLNRVIFLKTELMVKYKPTGHIRRQSDLKIRKLSLSLCKALNISCFDQNLIFPKKVSIFTNIL